jgi:cation:H+ antiporter
MQTPPSVSDPLLILVFLAAAAVSLATSWVLVSRLERIGARLGLSEALLGLLAALAADAPEITAAVSALLAHRGSIGTGVAIGSNVFNLAALLGLSAIVAGRIPLHRRVIALEGTIAVLLAVITVAVVAGGLTAVEGLALALVVLVPYMIVIGVRRERLQRLRLPRAWTAWLTEAIHEEEIELEDAIHPERGHLRDVLVAVGAVLVVVGVSVVMEHTASDLGTRHGIPQIVTGALILAAVTSVPNAVAAVYLARRGRGAATLSTALNSNALNVVVGLLLSGAILGLGPTSGQTVLVAAWYLGLTCFALGAAYATRGLLRVHGVVVVLGYLVFAAVLLLTA